MLSHFHLWIYFNYYWIYLCEGPSSVCCHVTSSIQPVILDMGACEYHNILLMIAPINLESLYDITLPPKKKREKDRNLVVPRLHGDGNYKFSISADRGK